MADTKVSALASTSTVNAGDYLMMVQAGSSVKIDIQTLARNLPTNVSILETPETPVSGTISTALVYSKLTSAAPNAAYTLAAGTHGMEKIIVCSTVNNAVSALTVATWATPTATFTTGTTPHGFLAGDTVTIAGMTPSGYNGVYVIGTVPTTTTFTVTNLTTLTAGTVFGTATKAGTASIAVTGGSGFTTVSMTDVKDSISLRNISGTWFITGSNSVVIA